MTGAEGEAGTQALAGWEQGRVAAAPTSRLVPGERNRGCANSRHQVWKCHFGTMPLLGHSATPELQSSTLWLTNSHFALQTQREIDWSVFPQKPRVLFLFASSVCAG